ncbi:MAG TPA: dTDP-4-dehydrorhamnose 3,5-epimerase, partial [Gemmatimonadota bacterium]|nr:dTDP-4-dehydrorhamnose 3,5-epimerase [Gemmatimonadota bacterium]
MNVTELELPGVLLLEPRVFGDERGFFLETWQARRYAEAGMPERFVQDNLSRSLKNVLRGLHYQIHRPQGKLVSVIEGEVFDVAADIDPRSETFGRWVGARLSGDNKRQLYIPPGYAHGFCVLSETAYFTYKCTEYYAPALERGVRWDDPTLGIDWPVDDPIVNERDAAWPTVEAARREELPEVVR